MKKHILFLLILLVLIVGCSRDYEIVERECKTDPDCTTGGCSGEICGPKDEIKEVASICEFRPEYECFNLAKCSCVNGKCQWIENEAFKECFDEKR